jgi:hypothetical protein
MFQALKKILLPLAFLAVLFGAVSVLQTTATNAAVSASGVRFLSKYGAVGDTTCAAGSGTEVPVSTSVGGAFSLSSTAADGDFVQLPSGNTIMCVSPDDNFGNVTFTSRIGADPAGSWDIPHCANLSDDCLNSTGLGGATLTIDDVANDIDPIAVTYSCSPGTVLDITIRQADNGDDRIDFTVICGGEPRNAALSALPSTVESNPAIYSTSHSLIRAVITDAGGGPALPGTTVDFSVDRCGITTTQVDTLAERTQALALFDNPPLKDYLAVQAFSDDGSSTPSLTATTVALQVDTNNPMDGVPNQSEALAIFHGEGCDPGPVTLKLEIDNPGTKNDIEQTLTINVVGPPAFIAISASPTQVTCGEKSEITVSVTDALNQQVSDNTRIEVLTNYGGVLAGTGTSLTTNQPVNPISSTTVEIFSGIGTAYLITSPQHVGPYEVLAASTPSEFVPILENSAPVTSQATVTCTLATSAPPVTAPDTGTGAIKPPNTGEAGLAGGFDNSTSLFVIAGAMIVALGGIVRLRFGRN